MVWFESVVEFIFQGGLVELLEDMFEDFDGD